MKTRPIVNQTQTLLNQILIKPIPQNTNLRLSKYLTISFEKDVKFEL